MSQEWQFPDFSFGGKRRRINWAIVRRCIYVLAALVNALAFISGHNSDKLLIAALFVIIACQEHLYARARRLINQLINDLEPRVGRLEDRDGAGQ